MASQSYEPLVMPRQRFAAPISVELLAEMLGAKRVEFQLCTQVDFVPAVSCEALARELAKKR